MPTDLWGYISELFRPTFWRQIVTRPLAAVRADPELAAKSAVIAGGAALAIGTGLVGGAVRAAATVGRAAVGLAAIPFRAAAVAAPALGFAARHPILTYIAIVNAELPTQIASAFQFRVAIGGAPPVEAFPPAPTIPAMRAPVSRIPPRHDAWARLFRGQTVRL
jgi:hypothetical protein